MPRVLQCCPGCSRQYDVAALAQDSPVRCSCGVAFAVAKLRALAPRALCCSRCGGTLRENARACEYCQAEITLEERRLDAICPKCYARMASDAAYCMSCGVRIEPQALAPLPSNARCPRCTSSLRSRRVGAESLIECPACAGLWVSPQLLERVCADAESRKSVAESLGSQPARATPAQDVLRYIPCPDCSQLMNRKNFGAISGIIIDVCKLHGVWLDHGEFERALAFSEKGGLVEARRRELSELEERKRRAESGLDSSDHAAWLEPEPMRSRHSPNLGGVLGWLASELLG